MTESYEDMSERRAEYIRCLRDNELSFILDTANADDLDWIIERIDAQLGETPNHVSDSKELSKIMSRLRHQRIALCGVMGNLRSIENREIEQRANRRSNFALILSGIAVLVAMLSLIRSW